MDIIIAVNLDHNLISTKYTKFTIAKTSIRSLNVLRHHLAKRVSQSADIIIEPKTGNVNWDKFANGSALVKVGEKATRKKISEIKNLLK